MTRPVQNENHRDIHAMGLVFCCIFALGQRASILNQVYMYLDRRIPWFELKMSLYLSATVMGWQRLKILGDVVTMVEHPERNSAEYYFKKWFHIYKANYDAPPSEPTETTNLI